MAKTKQAWKPLRSSSDSEDKKLWETQVNVAGTRRLTREAVANNESQVFDKLKEAGIPQAFGASDDSKMSDAGMFYEQLARGTVAPIRAAGARIMDATGLSGDHPMGDTITRQEQAFQSEMRQQKHPEGFAGQVSGGLMGAAQQLPTMVGVGALGGLPALVGMYSMQSVNDAYVQAIDEGLKPAAAWDTAVQAGIIEAGITLGFSAIGLGGAEKMATQAAKQRLLNMAIAKFGAKNLTPELLEEISIEMANAYREEASGVDYNATDPDKLWDRAVETAIQTVAMTSGMAVVQKGLHGKVQKENQLNAKGRQAYSAINMEAARMLQEGVAPEKVNAYIKEAKEQVRAALENRQSDSTEVATDEELEGELLKTFAERQATSEEVSNAAQRLGIGEVGKFSQPEGTTQGEADQPASVVDDDGEGVVPVQTEPTTLEVDAEPGTGDEPAPELSSEEALPETDDDVEAEMAQEPEEEISDAVEPETPAETEAVEPTDDVVEQDEVEAEPIGYNDRGQPLYEEANGLRYYMDDSDRDDPYPVYEPSTVDENGVTIPIDADGRPDAFKMVILDEEAEESQEDEDEDGGDILQATQDYARQLVEEMKAEAAEASTETEDEVATEPNDLSEPDEESEVAAELEGLANRVKEFMDADPEGGDSPTVRFEYENGVIFAPLMDGEGGPLRRWADKRNLGPLLSVSPLNEEDLGKKNPVFLTAELSEDHPRRKKYEHRMKLKGLLPTKLKPMVTFAKQKSQSKFLDQYGENAEAIEQATGLDIKEFWRQVRQGPREQVAGKMTPEKGKEWRKAAKEIGVNENGDRLFENQNDLRAILYEDGSMETERARYSETKGFTPQTKRERQLAFIPVRKSTREDVGEVDVFGLTESEATKIAKATNAQLRDAVADNNEIPIPESQSGQGVIGKDDKGYYARERSADEESIAVSRGDGPQDTGWVNVPPVKGAIEVIESKGAKRQADKDAIAAADLQTGQRVMVTSNDGKRQIGATVQRAPKEGSQTALVLLDNGEAKDIQGQLIQPDFDAALEARNERIEQGRVVDMGPNSDELGLDKGFAYPVGQFRRGERPKTLARASVSKSVPKIDGSSNAKAKNSISRLTQWLHNEAIEEAKAKNDADALRRFESMDVGTKSTIKKAWELPPADRDDMVDYVFGDGSIFGDPKPAEDKPKKPEPEPEKTKETSPAEVDNRSLDEISLDDLLAASNEIAGVQPDDPRPEQKSEVKQSTDNYTGSKAKKNLKDARKALEEEIGADVADLQDKLRSLKKKFDGRVNANPMFDADILQEATSILAQAVKLGVKKFRHFLIIAVEATDVDSTVRMGPLYEKVWNGLRERFPNIDLEEATDTQQILIEKEIIDEPVVVVEELVQEEKDFVDVWSRAEILYENPGKGEKVITEQRIESAGGYMTQSSADALIDQWTQRSFEQESFVPPVAIYRNQDATVNSGRWVVSLFDYSGVWCRPWFEAGYNVLQIDIQHGADVLDIANDPPTWFDENVSGVDWNGIHMVLAACPCTEFASSGAVHWKDKPPELLEDAQLLANATMLLTEWLDPHYYAIENPAGTIQKDTLVPDPRMSFHPNHFGNPYTKLTQLYGKFNPNLPLAPVYPVKGSEMHSQYGGSSLETKNKRSETPDGFAAAFFMANNYLDMSDRERLLVDFEDEGLVSKALDAGVTPERIRELAGVGSHETAITDELLDGFDDNLLAEANELRKEGEVLKITSPAPLVRTIEEIEALPKYTVYRQSAAKFLVRGDGKRGGGDTIHDTYADAEQAAKEQKSRDDEMFLEQGTSQELRDRAEEEIRRDYGKFLEFNPSRRQRAIAELERVKKFDDFTGPVRDFVRRAVLDNDKESIATARGMSDLVNDYVDHLMNAKDYTEQVMKGLSPKTDRGDKPAKWIGRARKELKGKFKEKYIKTTGKEDTRPLTEGVLGKKDYSELKALLTDLVGAEYVTTHRGSLRSKKDVIKALVGIQDSYDGLLMEMSDGKEVKRFTSEQDSGLVQARDAAMQFLLQQKQAIRWPDGYGGFSYISPYGYLERILTHKFPSISRNNLDSIAKEFQQAVDPDGSLAPIAAYTNVSIYLDPHYFSKGDGKSVKLLGQYEREQAFLGQSFKSIYDSLTDEGEARISGKVLEDAKDAHAQRYAERLVEEAKRKESAEREEVKDYHGFLPDNPMQAGRIRKSLELEREGGGKISSWKEYVEDRVKKGWVVGEDGREPVSNPVLMRTNKDGIIEMSPISITKTALNYAQFLIDEGFASKTGIVPINNEALQASRQKKGLAKKKVRQAPVTLDGEKIFDAAFAVWEQLHPDATSEEKSEMSDALDYFTNEIWSDYGYSLTGTEPFEDDGISYAGHSKIEWDEIIDEVLYEKIIDFLNRQFERMVEAKKQPASWKDGKERDFEEVFPGVVDYTAVINNLDQDAFDSLFAAVADAIERQMYKEASKPKKKKKKKKTLKEKASEAASVAEEKAEELRRKIRNLHSKPTMGVDLDLVRVAVDVARYKIEAGILSFAAFVQDFAANSHEGEMEIFGPYLDAAWKTLGEMSDDDRKVLGVEKADTTKEATWREALNSTHAEPAKEGKAGKPEPVEKTADENADAIENDPSGRIMPGFRMFISGMSRGPKDIKESVTKGRPVGVAYQSWHKSSGKFLTPNETVKGLLADHVNKHGLPIFIDSGMFGVVSRGEVGQEADYAGALAFYEEMLNLVEPELRSLVYVVAPDFLIQTDTGKQGIRGDHDKTVRLQLQYRNEIEELAGMGANVIIPIQRSYEPDESLVDQFMMDTRENFYTWSPNFILGIPYNAAAWSDDQISGLADYYQENLVDDQQTGGPLRMWLLGGGPSKLKPLYESLKEISPTIELYGDASTEIGPNRGNYDDSGTRIPKGKTKLDDDLLAADALEAFYTEGTEQGYEAILNAIDSHSDTWTRKDDGDKTLKELIDGAIRVIAGKILGEFTTDVTGKTKIDSDEFWNRIEDLFNRQPNKSFTNGKPDVFSGNPLLNQLLLHKYLQSPQAREETQDGEQGRSDDRGRTTDQAGRGEPDAQQDTADGTDGEVLAGEQQGDAQRTDTEGGSVGVRETPTGTTRQGSDETDADGEAGAERSGTDGERLVGDGSRTARGRDGVGESTRPNYHLTPDKWDAITGGGLKARFARNQRAIELAIDLTESGKPPTAEELDDLAAYTGWGAFGQELFQGSWIKGEPDKAWEEEDAWLREHLEEDAWKGMQTSIINAHYTSPQLVSTLWAAVRRLGFNGGRVLEPSVGSGNFFGIMPRDLMGKSHLTGVELDETTSKIAKLLYPQANIRNKGYEDIETADDFYDLAISNVPFGKTYPAQVKYPQDHMVHNFFFRRALDHVKPGGLVVFITGQGTMDGKSLAGFLREQMMHEASIVSAARLPSGFFQEYSKTNVVTDIIVVRKNRKDGKNPEGGETIWSKEGTNNVVPYETPSGETVETNKYWLDNPDNVFGTLDFGHGTTSGRPGLIINADSEEVTQSRLATWVKNLPENIANTDRDDWQGVERDADGSRRQRTIVADKESKGELRVYKKKDKERVLDKDGLPVFETVEFDGPQISIVDGESIVPLQASLERRGQTGWVKSNVTNPKSIEKRATEIIALAEVRDAYEALLTAQRNPEMVSTNKGKKERRKLNQAYDAFVKSHGDIAKSPALTVFKKAGDPMYASLSILARLDHKTGKYEKRAIFFENTVVGEIAELENASLGDAFAAERNRSMNLDYKAIAKAANLKPNEAIRQLLEAKFIYKTETGDYQPADTYLSGNVRKKQRALEAAIDEGMEGLEGSLDAIKKIIPAAVPHEQIEMRMGAHFVPTSVYADFLAEKLNIDSARVGVRLKQGKWTVALSPDINRSDEAYQWGLSHKVKGKDGLIPKYPFSSLVRAAMNNASIEIKTEKDEDGKQFVDEVATIEANEKLSALKEAYENWIWSDPERTAEVSSLYNEEYNSFVTPKFDQVPLTFVGIVTERDGKPFALRKHQREAVWRGLITGKGIFAHEVGTGKTLTMGALAMESRRFGYAKKPMLFAHNANAEAVAKEIQEAYPAARILFIDNVGKEAKEQAMAMIAAEDWDLIVVPHSLTDRFLLTEESLKTLMKDELDGLAATAAEAHAEDESAFKGAFPKDLDDVTKQDLKQMGRGTAKELVMERNKLVNEIKKAGKLSKANTLFFEDMGVDMVMVDEVHEYKKIPLVTAQRVKGLNTSGSKRGIILKLLTDHVRKANNGRGIYTFSGTPMTNTLNEIYNQMRFVMAEEMESAKIKSWDAWFNMFARSTIEPETTSGGTMAAVDRLREFQNLPELRQMVGQYLDIVFASDMEEFVARETPDGMVPDGEQPNGVPFNQTINITSFPNKFQQAYSEALIYRYMTFSTASGKEKREMKKILGDPYSPLTIESEGVKMSLDPRMTDLSFNPEFSFEGIDDIDPLDPELKVNKMIAEAMPIYRGNPKATQMIFMETGHSDIGERSTGQRDKKGKLIKEKVRVFNLAAEIKRRLIQEGVPENEIALFSGMTAAKRTIAAEKMRRGEIRYAIGSTQTMGVGVNAQDYMAAIHHLDCPWMPGWLEQRNGRGRRQGNRFNTIKQFRYVCENKQDTRRWQVALIKDTFIRRFMKGEFVGRSMDMSEVEVGDSSDLEATMATAAGDPRILHRNKLEGEVARLTRKSEAFASNVQAQVDNAKRKARSAVFKEQQNKVFQSIYRMATEAKPKLREDDVATLTFPNGEEKQSKGYKPGTTSAGVSIITSDLIDLAEAYKKTAFRGKDAGLRQVGKWRGLAIYYEVPAGGIMPESPQLYLGLEDSDPNPMLLRSIKPTLNSMEAQVRQLPTLVKKNTEAIALDNAAVERSKEAMKAKFPKQAQLDKAVDALEKVRGEIRENPDISPPWFRMGAPVGTGVFWKGDEYTVQNHRQNTTVIAVDKDEKIVELPAKELLDEADGLPLYPELQEGYDGPIDTSVKVYEQVTVRKYSEDESVKIDLGSYSNDYTPEQLDAIGVNPTNPAAYKATGRIVTDTEVGAKTFQVEFVDLKSKTEDKDGITEYTGRITLTVKPIQEEGYGAISIAESNNPIHHQMEGLYRKNLSAAVFVNESRNAGKQILTLEQEIAIDRENSGRSPQVLHPLAPFDVRLEHFHKYATVEMAQEWDAISPIEQHNWIDEQLAGQLYEYIKQPNPEQTDLVEPVTRTPDEVEQVVEQVEETLKGLLGLERKPRGSFALRIGQPRPIRERGKGGSKRREIDVARNKTIGMDAASSNPIGAEEIISRVSSLFDLPIRRGQIRASVMGMYRHLSHVNGDHYSPEVIRVNRRDGNNLAVLAHEVAHHVDEITQTSRTGFPSHIEQRLEDFDYDQNRTDGPQVEEGWAEFIRGWATLSRKQRKKIAGFKQVQRWFETTWADAHPQEYANLKKMRALLKRYSDQTVFERLQSTIRFASDDTLMARGKRIAADLTSVDGVKYQYERLLEGKAVRAYAAAKDRYYALKVLEKFHRRFVYDENKRRRRAGQRELHSYYSQTESAYEYAMATHNTAVSNAEHAMRHGVFLISPQSTGSRPVIQNTAIADAMSAIQNERDLEHAEVYMIAHHIVNMDKKKKAQGVNDYVWPMEVSEAKKEVKAVEADNARFQRYENLRQAANRFNNGLIAMLQDAGVISGEEFARMMRPYSVDEEKLDGSLYVPLMRVTEKNKNRAGGSGHLDVGKGVRSRSRKGSDIQVISPMQSLQDRAMTFYRVAQAVQLQKLVYQESLQAPGMGKFVERIDPAVSGENIPVAKILDDLVKEGLVEEELATSISLADYIRRERERQGTKKYIDIIPKDAEEQLMDLAGYKAGKYKNKDIKKLLNELPTAMSVITLWRQDYDLPTRQDNNIKHFVHDGEDILVRLSDELIHALSGNHKAMQSAAVRYPGTLSRWFKWGAVASNTKFGMRQIPMDYITNAFQAREQGIERYWMPLVYSAQFALANMRASGANDTNALRQLFRANAGQKMNVLTADQTGKRNMLKTMTQAGQTMGLGRTPARAPNNIKKFFENLIAVSDVGPRYAEYIASLRNSGYEVNGTTGRITRNGQPAHPARHHLNRAINAAADVTYNHRRTGRGGQVVEQFLPFFNAKLEGQDKRLRTFKNIADVGYAIMTGDARRLEAADVRGAAYTSTNTLLALGVGVLYYMLKSDDDEYQEEEFWQRGRGFSFGAINGIQQFFIPNSREFAFVFGIGEYIGMKYDEFVTGENKDVVSDKEKELVKQNLGEYLTEPQTAGMRIVSQEVSASAGNYRAGFLFDSGAISTGLGAWANYKMFQGRAIEPEWMEQKKIPKQERYTAYTSEWAKWIGKHSNTGPMYVDYVLGDASGGGFSRASRLYDEANEGDITATSIPFLGGIYTNRHQKRSVNDLYVVSRTLLRMKQDHAYAIPGSVWSDKHERFREDVEKARDLQSVITKVARNSKSDVRSDVSRIAVGLARDALGRKPQVSNPSPWMLQKSQFPDVLTKGSLAQPSFYQELKDDVAGLIDDLTPSKATKDVYSDGKTRDEVNAERKAKAEYAKDWLERHSKSPIVREVQAEERAKGSKSKPKSRKKKSGFRNRLSY